MRTPPMLSEGLLRPMSLDMSIAYKPPERSATFSFVFLRCYNALLVIVVYNTLRFSSPVVFFSFPRLPSAAPPFSPWLFLFSPSSPFSPLLSLFVPPPWEMFFTFCGLSLLELGGDPAAQQPADIDALAFVLTRAWRGSSCPTPAAVGLCRAAAAVR